MDKKTTTSVRQILMNELGLTRENVRTEMENIIHDTIDKHLKKMWHSDEFQKILTRIIINQFKQAHTFGAKSTLKEMVLLEAHKKVGKFIDENIFIKGK